MWDSTFQSFVLKNDFNFSIVSRFVELLGVTRLNMLDTYCFFVTVLYWRRKKSVQTMKCSFKAWYYVDKLGNVKFLNGMIRCSVVRLSVLQMSTLLPAVTQLFHLHFTALAVTMAGTEVHSILPILTAGGVGGLCSTSSNITVHLVFVSEIHWPVDELIALHVPVY